MHKVQKTYSLFPAGFPLLGTSPVATIYIMPLTRTLQDSYVLTASPKIRTPDLTMHTIPDCIIRDNVSGVSSVPATGTKTGATARGLVNFSNASGNEITYSAGTVLVSASGILFLLSDSVTIPAHKNGQNGHATVAAMATSPGATSNRAAHALDGPCCAPGVTIRNPEAFSDGSDGQGLHIVMQSDLVWRGSFTGRCGSDSDWSQGISKPIPAILCLVDSASEQSLKQMV
jgi:hypothetical protein